MPRWIVELLLMSLLVEIAAGMLYKQSAKCGSLIVSTVRTRPLPGVVKRYASGLRGDNAEQKPPKKVAIVGGGLAGLATAHHLLKQSPDIQITIYDPRSPGKAEASSVAGGLLHPLSPKNKLVWRGEEGFEESWKLVQAAKAGLEAHDPHAAEILESQPFGIVRPALTPAHERDYQKAVRALPQWLDYLDGEVFAAHIGLLSNTLPLRAGQKAPEAEEGKVYRGGLVLRGSVVVSMVAYLTGLWLHMQHTHPQNVAWVRERVAGPDAVATLVEKGHDTVVLAMGAGLRGFRETAGLEVELVQGRTLLLTPPHRTDIQDTGGTAGPLNEALLCGEYVVPGYYEGTTAKAGEPPCSSASAAREEGATRRVLRCGATREYLPPDAYIVRTEEEDAAAEAQALRDDEAMRSFRDKVQRLYPPAAGMATLKVATGTRVATKRSNLGKLPIVGRLPHTQGDDVKAWVFTGLGGRGLIHHAVLGRDLASAILASDESKLPTEVVPRSRD